MIPKFRAWNAETKAMYEVKSLVFTLRSMFCVNRKLVYPERTFYFDDENIRSMQSTELKDKNDVEIFDADVVKMRHTIYDDFEFFKVTKSRGGTWLIGNRRCTVPLWLRNEDCEVIGNIYQNPELLESVEE